MTFMRSSITYSVSYHMLRLKLNIDDSYGAVLFYIMLENLCMYDRDSLVQTPTGFAFIKSE